MNTVPSYQEYIQGEYGSIIEGLRQGNEEPYSGAYRLSDNLARYTLDDVPLKYNYNRKFQLNPNVVKKLSDVSVIKHVDSFLDQYVGLLNATREEVYNWFFHPEIMGLYDSVKLAYRDAICKAMYLSMKVNSKIEKTHTFNPDTCYDDVLNAVAGTDKLYLLGLIANVEAQITADSYILNTQNRPELLFAALTTLNSWLDEQVRRAPNLANEVSIEQYCRSNDVGLFTNSILIKDQLAVETISSILDIRF